MLFSDDDLKTFQEIYKEDFGEPISEGDARLMATRLIRLYEALTTPLPDEREQLARLEENATIETGRTESEACSASPVERSFINKPKL
jgi:hypothetical protein